MVFQTVFQRYELKYILRRRQKEEILRAMEPYVKPDRYGPTVIRNLYFDTEDYRLIRQSIEKPIYKEKLRVRSYKEAKEDGTVFVELKKKYKGIVYKRRLSLGEADAMHWLCRRSPCPMDTQISREIDCFADYYGPLRPTVFLSYEREAFFAKECDDFRVTFDERILCRQSALSLCAPPDGTPILPKDLVLMEIKCAGGIPIWMARTLSENRLYKTSFSKYGTAYQTLICPTVFPGSSKGRAALNPYHFEEEFLHA